MAIAASSPFWDSLGWILVGFFFKGLNKFNFTPSLVEEEGPT